MKSYQWPPIIRQENVSFLPYVYNIIDYSNYNSLSNSAVQHLMSVSAYLSSKISILYNERTFILKFIFCWKIHLFWNYFLGGNFFASQSHILTWILLLNITINGNSVGQCYNISCMSCKLPPMTMTSR